MFQELNGDPKPEREWRLDDYWNTLFPRLFRDYSSFELEDDQEQVGLRKKVKRRDSFSMSFFLKFISVHSLLFCSSAWPVVGPNGSSGVFYQIKHPSFRLNILHEVYY